MSCWFTLSAMLTMFLGELKVTMENECIAISFRRCLSLLTGFFIMLYWPLFSSTLIFSCQDRQKKELFWLELVFMLPVSCSSRFCLPPTINSSGYCFKNAVVSSKSKQFEPSISKHSGSKATRITTMRLSRKRSTTVDVVFYREIACINNKISSVTGIRITLH